jgi:serine/threonine protein kinase/tetratricopeptide (TPR) repeat protein
VVGSTVQHYRVRGRLGTGGMGEVYLAEDTRLGREVALKFIAPDSQADEERRARLLTEARAASALRSSNIAQIFDIGDHEGTTYLVMEYVEGEPLSARIARGALPVREAVDIVLQVADALTEAHGRGIVHRDIKSANIMLTPRGQAKVLDFGLAKFLQPPGGSAAVDAALTFEHTVAGLVLGTVSYMAPEQALGRSVDGRSDLFSLGVVLYEALTGRLPFEGASFTEVIDAILNHAAAPATRYVADLPPQIESVLRKALEKNPDFRYQHARDLYLDLHAIRGDLDDLERHRGGRLPDSSSGLHAPSAAAPGSTVAVVTFSNVTREPSDEWIGAGIAETVTSDLKNVKGITVIGRERVFDALRMLSSGDGPQVDDRFAIELGRGLHARWIVSGGYQRLGERLRITARFVEVQTGVVLRNVKLDGALADIFDLQDRIVFELTDGLKLHLERSTIAEIEKDETRSIAAYELFSRGMMTLRMASREAPDRAISLFEQALAIDPEYAEAWMGLGGGYQIKGVFLNLPELSEKAVEYERKAIALDPALADAHTWLGAALIARGRTDEAMAALRKAVDLDPGQARPWAMLARGYWVGKGKVEEGIDALERAVAINPEFGYAHLQLAFLYTELEQYEKAEAAAEKAVDLQERYTSGEEGLLIVGAHTRLGYVHYRRGRYEDAVREYQSELVYLSASDHMLKERALIELHQKLGAAYHRLNRAADAERHLRLAIRNYEERVARGADDPNTKYYAAVAHALRGDTDKAVRYLEDTFPKLGALNRLRIGHDPDLESVHPALAAKGMIE